MKIRVYVAITDPLVRRTLVAALRTSSDIAVVGLADEADVVVDDAAEHTVARLDPAPQDTDGALTGRELAVLRLAANGLANKEIARELGISRHTVKYHLASVLAKLGVHSRTEAVTMGLRRGLVPL